MSGRNKQKARASRPRTTAPVVTGISLSALILELRRLQHGVAVLEHIAGRLFQEYSAEEGEPRFLVTTGTEAPVIADSDALIETAGLLARAAEEGRRRMREILTVQLPGSPGVGATESVETPVETTDSERFNSRVVAAPRMLRPSSQRLP